MQKLFILLISAFFSVTTWAADDAKTLTEQETTRYFVCGFLHKEDSYEIAKYLRQEYEVVWYTNKDKHRKVVADRLKHLAQQQGTSKFKAEDILASKYKCDTAYIELIKLDKIKI